MRTTPMAPSRAAPVHLTWDVENRPVAVSSTNERGEPVTSTYVYGLDGLRLKKIVHMPAGVEERLNLGSGRECSPDGVGR